MKDIIQNITTKTEGKQNYLPVSEKKLSYEHGMVTPSLFGEKELMILDSKESTVQYSETKANICRVSLSDRLMQSLISAGLVKGIIPMSMRVRSNQQTLDVVLKKQGGECVE